MNVQVTTVVMLLFLAGIALVGVGIGTLMKDNKRNNDIAAYNAALAAYASSRSEERIKSTLIDIVSLTPSVRFPLQEIPYGFSGEQEGIPSTGNILRQWSTMASSAATYTVSISVNGVKQAADIILPNEPPENPFNVPFNCTSPDVENEKGCSGKYLTDKCREYAKTEKAVYVSTDPKTDQCPLNTLNCGLCQFSIYLVARNNFLVYESGTWRLDKYTVGFTWPFQFFSHIYNTTRPPKINVTLRSYDEPFNVANNATGNTMDFGQTSDSQRNEGLAVLATGAAMSGICAAGVIFSKVVLAKVKKRDKLNQLGEQADKDGKGGSDTEGGGGSSKSGSRRDSKGGSGKNSKNGSRRGSQSSQPRDDGPPQGFGPKTGGPSSWGPPPEWQSPTRGERNSDPGKGGGGKRGSSGGSESGGSSKRGQRQKNYRGDRNSGGSGDEFTGQKNTDTKAAAYNRQQVAALVGKSPPAGGGAAAKAGGGWGGAAASGWGGGGDGMLKVPQKGSAPPQRPAPPKSSAAAFKDDDL